MAPGVARSVAVCAVLLAIGGCGSTAPAGYLNMKTLAAAFEAKGARESGSAGIQNVVCIKTGSLTALCSGSYPKEVTAGHQSGRTEQAEVTISADGKNYIGHR
jgi:hypothetical protein